MEVPKPGVKSELQLWAYTTATAMWDPSHLCNLHCSFRQQLQVLNPLGEAGGQTWILMNTSQVLNPLSHNGNSHLSSSFHSPCCTPELTPPNSQGMELSSFLLLHTFWKWRQPYLEKEGSSVLVCVFCRRQTQVWNLPLPFNCCVTPNKLLTSLSSLPHL